MGSIPGSGRSSGVGNGNPLQYSCPENSMDRGAWRVTVHSFSKTQTGLGTAPLPFTPSVLPGLFLHFTGLVLYPLLPLGGCWGERGVDELLPIPPCLGAPYLPLSLPSSPSSEFWREWFGHSKPELILDRKRTLQGNCHISLFLLDQPGVSWLCGLHGKGIAGPPKCPWQEMKNEGNLGLRSSGRSWTGCRTELIVPSTLSLSWPCLPGHLDHHPKHVFRRGRQAN